MLETDFQTFLSLIHHHRECPENIFLDLRSYSNRPYISETNLQQLITALKSENFHQGLTINLRGNQLGDENIAALAAFLKSGFAPKNLKLDLRMNAITAIGAKHLAAALKSGQAPQGLELNLASNYIGDAGMRAIADALASGQAPADLALNLGFNDVSNDGILALLDVLKSGKTPQGLQLNIRHNKLSKADIDAFKEGFISSKVDPTIKLVLNSEDFTSDIEVARVFGLAAQNLYQKEISFDDVIKDKHKKPDILYAAVKLACQLNNLSALDLLMTYGAVTDMPDDKTPLSIACENGFFDIVRYLINKDAFINAQDKYGWSATDYARENGHTQIVEYLETFKKNTNLLKPITPPYQSFKYSAINKLIDEIIKKSKEGAEEVESFLKQYPDLYFYCKLYNPQKYEAMRKEIENNLSKVQISEAELPQEKVQKTTSEEPIAPPHNEKPDVPAPEEPPMRSTYNVKLTPIQKQPFPKCSLDEVQENIIPPAPKPQNEPIFSSKDNTKKNKITALALTIFSCLFVITIPFAGMIYRKIYQHLSNQDNKLTTGRASTSEDANHKPMNTKAINTSLTNSKPQSLPQYEVLPKSYFKKPQKPQLASWPKTYFVYLYFLFGPDPFPDVTKKHLGTGVKCRRSR